jgi:hypothetical protein
VCTDRVLNEASSSMFPLLNASRWSDELESTDTNIADLRWQCHHRRICLGISSAKVLSQCCHQLVFEFMELLIEFLCAQ